MFALRGGFNIIVRKHGSFLLRTAIGIIIGAVILVIFSCSNEGEGFLANLLKGDGGGVPVTVESVMVEERQGKLIVPAKVEPAETTEVSLPDDVVVESVLVTEGQSVPAGYELIRLSEADFAAKLAKMRADARDAQANLERDSYFARNKDRLLAEGRIDQTQYDNIDAEVEKGEAELERMRLDLSRMEERAASTSVTSPVAGVVSRIDTAPGLATPAGKPIVTIANSDRLVLSFRLPAAYSTVARAGQTVKVRFPDTGDGADARVTSVGTQVDGRDNAFDVKASVPNPGMRFKAGMRAEVSVPTSERRRVFIVPEEALIRERGAVFVFTVDRRTARKIQVLPSDSKGSRVEITRGLKEDDIVVVRGNDKISDGTVVDIWKR